MGMIMKTIGDRLIWLREQNNLTKIEMSQKLNVNKSTISRYENNEMKPNVDMLIEIAKKFGVSIDWILGLDTAPMREFDAVITECLDSNITPEQLSKIINLTKATAELMKGD